LDLPALFNPVHVNLVNLGFFIPGTWHHASPLSWIQISPPQQYNPYPNHTQNNAGPGLWIVSKWRRLDSYLSFLAHRPF
jgi:hypothetical protein